MPRICIKGGLYFITTRVDLKQGLFKDDEDRKQYVDLLAKYKKEYKFKLFAYVLLPNLTHLLIEPADGTTISDIMHVINSTYTKYFNSRYGRHGHVFQGRFKACIAERNLYLKELVRYIHVLPVNSGLANKPDNYDWSSYRVSVDAAEDTVKIKSDFEEVLQDFLGTHQEQIRQHVEFTQSAGKDILEHLKKKVQSSSILGSKTFTENVKERLKDDEREEIKENEKAWIGSRSHKVFMILGSVLVLILTGITVYLYRANLGLVINFENKLEQRETELVKKLEKEKEKIAQDLGEKHEADKVSFKAMVKRLEIEKEKSKKAEEKIKAMEDKERG